MRKSKLAVNLLLFSVLANLAQYTEYFSVDINVIKTLRKLIKIRLFFKKRRVKRI